MAGCCRQRPLAGGNGTAPRGWEQQRPQVGGGGSAPSLAAPPVRIAQAPPPGGHVAEQQDGGARNVIEEPHRAPRVPGPARAMVTEQEVEAIGRTLVDPAQPLPARFRALFTLRNLGGPTAVNWISRAFGDGSALLKHELAFCLGQMQDEAAIPVLIRVLEDTAQEPMVRHEAGEALGAIGSPDVLDILKRYSEDPVVEVAETCQLAVRRLEWLQSNKEKPDTSPYLSVDPAPPAEETDVAKLQEILLDESQELFDRYRAMFALRNVGGQAAVLALAEGLRCGSALFRHEIGYVLGQLQDEACVPQLTATLCSRAENPMVRHECAEALGSIARPSCLQALRAFAADEERVVRESCQVALDMYEYENGTQFQYADGLCKLQASS